MNSPVDDYRILKNLDNVWDVAYFTLFEKYMKYGLRGDSKKIEIDSTDQESIIIEKNGGFPIPGLIYTFLYKGPNVIVQRPIGDPKEYTDLVPLVFCMGIEREKFSGINLNALPPEARLRFLQSFYESFEEFLKREVDVLSQNDRLALNKKFIALMKSGNGAKVLQLFSNKTRENFKFAYRTYSIGKVDNLRMIEYPEWKYIPFYRPKDAFRKLNQIGVYKLYGEVKRDI